MGSEKSGSSLWKAAKTPRWASRGNANPIATNHHLITAPKLSLLLFVILGMVLLGLIAATALVGSSADVPRAVRVPVHHADPYMIKALLEGRQVMAPEISTLLALGGGNLVGAAAATALFTDGYWFVNPTDNSLWFVSTPGKTGR